MTKDSLNPITLNEDALRDVSILTACATGGKTDEEGLKAEMAVNRSIIGAYLEAARHLSAPDTGLIGLIDAELSRTELLDKRLGFLHAIDIIEKWQIGLGIALEELKRKDSFYNCGVSDAIAIVRAFEKGDACIEGPSVSVSADASATRKDAGVAAPVGDSVRSAEVTGKVGVAHPASDARAPAGHDCRRERIEAGANGYAVGKYFGNLRGYEDGVLATLKADAPAKQPVDALRPTMLKIRQLIEDRKAGMTHDGELTEELLSWADDIDTALEAKASEITDNTAIKQRDALWMLLDDIDTLSDMAKTDYEGFAKHCYAIQQRRHAILHSDDITPPTTGGNHG